MKKLVKTGFALLVVFCMTVFLGCVDGNFDVNSGRENRGFMQGLGKHEGLDAATELQILQDYIETIMSSEDIDVFKDEVWFEKPETAFYISSYLGTYNGWVVVIIHDPFPKPGIVIELNIGGFVFDVSFPIIVWGDGNIHTIQKAYELGLLTVEDLEKIQDL